MCIRDRYYADRMRAAPINLARGLMQGGALGLAGAGVGEAMATTGDAIDKAAYNAGGAVTDLTGSPAAGYVANVATQVVPTVLTGQGAKVMASPMMESAGKRIMQAALKPTWEANRTGKDAKAIDTLLEEGVNPTEAGVQKLRGMIGKLNDDISADIANSPATVNKAEIGKVMKEK